jgi:hypothetical protein
MVTCPYIRYHFPPSTVKKTHGKWEGGLQGSGDKGKSVAVQTTFQPRARLVIEPTGRGRLQGLSGDEGGPAMPGGLCENPCPAEIRRGHFWFHGYTDARLVGDRSTKGGTWRLRRQERAISMLYYLGCSGRGRTWGVGTPREKRMGGEEDERHRSPLRKQDSEEVERRGEGTECLVSL